MSRRSPPAALTRLFEDAAAAWRRQDYDTTIDLLRRANRQDPANVQVLMDLGRAHGLRYEYSSAEDCFERAIGLSPTKSDVLAEAGRRCQEFGHYAMALGYLDRASESPGVPVECLLSLAELHERHHRLDPADECVSRVLAGDPRHARGRLTQARLLRIRGKLEEAECIVREILGSDDDSARIRAGYELGGLLDRQGRYDEAMSAFQSAKALQQPAARGFEAILAGVQARVREMQESLTREVLRGWADADTGSSSPLRIAILCGHPRSGTTLLEQALDAHPEIVTAEETHILHDEAYLPLCQGKPQDSPVLEVLESATAARLAKSRADYFRFTELFTGKPIGSALLVDKNPALNVLLPAVARLFPEGRFLVALRDPRDVCLSCFMQPLTLNPVSSAYLTLSGTVVQYASVMGFWRFLRPILPQRWLEVRYEEVVADLERECRRVLEFLGVGWDSSVLRFHEHARTQPVRSPSYADVVKPVYRGALGRWRNYQSYLEPHLKELRPLMTSLGYE